MNSKYIETQLSYSKGWCFGAKSIDDALSSLKQGKPIIVIDDESRENEGDLILPAESATVESLAFMIKHTSGIICVGVPEDRLETLGLQQMVPNNQDPKQTAFTVSCDLKTVGTGISAADRCATIKALADPSTVSSELNRPGHIFPLRAVKNGVLVRQGHTEASVDFCRLSGLQPVGVLSEITNDDGTMARLPELQVFAKEHNLVLTSIQDLITYRLSKDNLVECVIPGVPLPTKYGEFTCYSFQSLLDSIEHPVLVKGVLNGQEPTLVRIHSKCQTGDIFGSLRCDCGDQLSWAMQTINDEGLGVIIYLSDQEGRGIGFSNKLKAYELQDQGNDTYQANEELSLPIDLRNYRIAAQILSNLGVKNIKLMTNNPDKYNPVCFKEHGLNLHSRIPIIVKPNQYSQKYFDAKQLNGHMV